MNSFHKLISFLKFLLKAKPLAGYGIHSPFVFNFTTNVLRKFNKQNIPLTEFEYLKKRLKSDDRLLEIVDFGAIINKRKTQKVSAIFRQASTKLKYCRLLYGLGKEIKPKTIIELGTSLGISTSALSLAMPEITIHTIEGSESIARVAEENFKMLGLKNIKQYIGEFNEHFETILKEIKIPALVYVDGNHKYEPTVSYFTKFAEKMDDESIIIIDDIHWSKEMTNAWNDICNYHVTTIKLDLFQMGIVFFKKDLPKIVYNILY